MLDKLSRDQFVIKYGDEVVVQWNDGRRFRSEEAYKRTYWTESFVQWCAGVVGAVLECDRMLLSLVGSSVSALHTRMLGSRLSAVAGGLRRMSGAVCRAVAAFVQ